MKWRYLALILCFITPVWSMEWILASAGALGLGRANVTRDYGLQSAFYNPALPAARSGLLFGYSPAYADFGIKELSLSAHVRGKMIQPSVMAFTQHHSLMQNGIIRLQQPLYHRGMISAGAGIEAVYSTVKGHPGRQSLSAAAGILVRPHEQITAGMSFAHLGTVYLSDNRLDLVPAETIWGLDYRPFSWMAVHFSAIKIDGYPFSLAAGSVFHWKDILSVGISWDKGQNMARAGLTLSAYGFTLSETIQWHPWLPFSHAVVLAYYF